MSSADQTSTNAIEFKIDPSKIKAQLASIGVLLTFAVSFTTAVAGLAAKRDLGGFIALMQRDDTLTGLAAMVAFGTVIWRQVVVRKRKDTEIALAVTSPVGSLTKAVMAPEGSKLADAMVTATQINDATATSTIQHAIDTGAVAVTPAVAAAIAPNPPAEHVTITRYMRSSTLPMPPGDSSLFPPGWTDVPPADNGLPLWETAALFLGERALSGWSSPVRSLPGIVFDPPLDLANMSIADQEAPTAVPDGQRADTPVMS